MKYSNLSISLDNGLMIKRNPVFGRPETVFKSENIFKILFSHFDQILKCFRKLKNKMSALESANKMYSSVVNDVINSCKDAFQDEGYDEQVLTDLKNLWSRKLTESGVLAPQQRQQVRYQYSNVRPGFRQGQPVQGNPQSVRVIYPGQQQGQQRIIVQNRNPGGPQPMVVRQVVRQPQQVVRQGGHPQQPQVTKS